MNVLEHLLNNLHTRVKTCFAVPELKKKVADLGFVNVLKPQEADVCVVNSPQALTINAAHCKNIMIMVMAMDVNYRPLCRQVFETHFPKHFIYFKQLTDDFSVHNIIYVGIKNSDPLTALFVKRLQTAGLQQTCRRHGFLEVCNIDNGHHIDETTLRSSILQKTQSLQKRHSLLDVHKLTKTVHPRALRNPLKNVPRDLSQKSKNHSLKRKSLQRLRSLQFKRSTGRHLKAYDAEYE
jgi:predicted lipid carrier protein YhbT